MRQPGLKYMKQNMTCPFLQSFSWSSCSLFGLHFKSFLVNWPNRSWLTRDTSVVFHLVTECFTKILWRLSYCRLILEFRERLYVQQNRQQQIIILTDLVVSFYINVHHCDIYNIFAQLSSMWCSEVGCGGAKWLVHRVAVQCTSPPGSNNGRRCGNPQKI